ncbi:MAG TPA: hypothetical protein VN950_28205 [Terriglobales bacterium]|nr:hypothetical protein [Terriglobales bacterium]
MTRTAFFILLALSAVCPLWAQPSDVSSTNKASPETGNNPAKGAIPATFFGMNVHVWVTQDQPWPAVPFGSFRFWDSATGWAQINTAKDRYDWSQLDKWLIALKARHVDDALYTFGRVPGFASSKPSDQSCAYGPGQCDPPSDLKSDGSGSDQYWKDFVEAIVTHGKNSRTVRIKYWEIWNEPYLPSFWTGSMAQMVRMASDAQSIIHRIDPDAIVLTPPAPLRYPRYAEFMPNYLAAGGGKYADAIAFHGYVHGKAGVHPVAADFITYLGELRKVLAQYGQNSKPLWDTEASWGNEEVYLPDEDMQAAFLAQFYLIHWSQGVERLYWYAYNDGAVGRLWIPDAHNPSRPGRVTKAGIAYTELESWLVGSTMIQPCAPDGSKWTCGITTADGHEAQIVWSPDSEQSYTPKPAFKRMRELDKQTTAVSGPVKIGPKPVLLESQP